MLCSRTFTPGGSWHRMLNILYCCFLVIVTLCGILQLCACFLSFGWAPSNTLCCMVVLACRGVHDVHVCYNRSLGTSALGSNACHEDNQYILHQNVS